MLFGSFSCFLHHNVTVREVLVCMLRTRWLEQGLVWTIDLCVDMCKCVYSCMHAWVHAFAWVHAWVHAFACVYVCIGCTFFTKCSILRLVWWPCRVTSQRHMTSQGHVTSYDKVTWRDVTSYEVTWHCSITLFIFQTTFPNHHQQTSSRNSKYAPKSAPNLNHFAPKIVGFCSVPRSIVSPNFETFCSELRPVSHDKHAFISSKSPKKWQICTNSAPNLNQFAPKTIGLVAVPRSNCWPNLVPIRSELRPVCC